MKPARSTPVRRPSRTLLALLPLALCLTLAASLPARAADAAAADAMRTLLAQSLANNKGVTVYMGGASIGLVVTAIEGCCIVGRNQQFTRVVVRLDRIDAVSASF